MTMARSLLTVLVLVLASTTHAQQGRSWQDLSPAEREQAWRNYQRFETMPPQRRQHLEDRYQRFRQMPPTEQERLRRNYQRWKERHQ